MGFFNRAVVPFVFVILDDTKDKIKKEHRPKKCEAVTYHCLSGASMIQDKSLYDSVSIIHQHKEYSLASLSSHNDSHQNAIVALHKDHDK